MLLYVDYVVKLMASLSRYKVLRYADDGEPLGSLQVVEVCG